MWLPTLRRLLRCAHAFVIPAKAGIHVDFRGMSQNGLRLSPE
jgi:hypothetical protein